MEHKFVKYPNGDIKKCHTPELWLENVDKSIYKKEALVFLDNIEDNTPTPGPWFALPNEYYVEIKTSNHMYGYTIASAQENEYAYVTRDVCMANAKLIAAAPELLEALEDLLHECQHMYEATFATINKAIEAINKATL